MRNRNFFYRIAVGYEDIAIGRIVVKNLTTGDEMIFTGLPGSELTIRIDNENQVITEEVSGYDLYDYFNFGFLRLDPGDNELVFTGNGSVTLKGRYLYNVGA